MLTILSAVFVFGVLVTVHELGHFLAAKAMGMRTGSADAYQVHPTGQ